MPEHKKYDKAVVALLKAEAFCTELLNNGILFEHITYEAIGSFKRSYRPDIDAVTSSDLHDTVNVKVNRDGIYDKLPEGLFHQPKGTSRTRSVTDMVEESRRYRQEEKQARKFFQSLEQEFFYHSVMIEQEERYVVSEMLKGSLDQIFSDFWDIKNHVPEEHRNTLEQIMPWLYRIKGNRHLTARALELVLCKPVSVSERFEIKEFETEESGELESMALGVNSVSGKGFWDNTVTWTFLIEELTTEELVQYMDGATYAGLLSRFEELFIPLDIEVCYDFGLKEEVFAEPVMGFSLTI